MILMSKIVIFDFDGTLIDTSRGILDSLSFAFESLNITPDHSLTPQIIGPPLNQTLQFLCPNSSSHLLADLQARFRHHYDSFGIYYSLPFSGVIQMLCTLQSSNISLNIATNKRAIPTAKILSLLGWQKFFDSVLTIDDSRSDSSPKTSLLRQVLNIHSVPPSHCLYVGDRLTDYEASRSTNIPFAFACWGFESADQINTLHTCQLHSPNAHDIIGILQE